MSILGFVFVAKILEQKHKNVEFLIHVVGECSELIRNRISELRLGNVKLSDKLLPSRKDVVCLYNQADALILPMKDYGRPYLGIPSKLYEYQAARKPTICCAMGVPAGFVNETSSGTVILSR